MKYKIYKIWQDKTTRHNDVDRAFYYTFKYTSHWLIDWLTVCYFTSCSDYFTADETQCGSRYDTNNPALWRRHLLRSAPAVTRRLGLHLNIEMYIVNSLKEKTAQWIAIPFFHSWATNFATSQLRMYLVAIQFFTSFYLFTITSTCSCYHKYQIA